MSVTVRTRSGKCSKVETSRNSDPVDLTFSCEVTDARGSKETKEQERPHRERKSVMSPEVFAALGNYYTWQIVTKLVLGVIYMQTIAEGFRFLVPALGQKVSKIPGLGMLAHYEATYRLDLAVFFSFFMLIAVFFLWNRIIQLWLEVDGGQEYVGANADHQDQLIVTLGFVVLGADLCLFYLAVTKITWGGSSFSFTAFLATCAYAAVLIFVSYVSVILDQRVVKARRLQQR